jgi:nitronate monooxygenase
MAGGPATPALAAAVAGAGGYPFVAGGYLTAAALAEAIAATRELTAAPLGVNLFVPSAPADPAAVAAYAATLEPEAARLGAPLGPSAWDDDDYPAKLDVVVVARPDLVSFTFGGPAADVVARLHAAGIRVAVTVTASDEAVAAAGAGADLLVVQGTEAGGHQGGANRDEPNRIPLLELIAAVRAACDLPVIGGGGVGGAAGLRAVLDSGAIAAVVGTALLDTPEAGTSAVHRRALADTRFGETVLTRAYSGRWGRGLANRFAREHPDAPRAYPEVNRLTGPLRRAARAAGDPEVPNLWAGTGWRAVRAAPAAEIVRALAS